MSCCRREPPTELACSANADHRRQNRESINRETSFSKWPFPSCAFAQNKERKFLLFAIESHPFYLWVMDVPCVPFSSPWDVDRCTANKTQSIRDCREKAHLVEEKSMYPSLWRRRTRICVSQSRDTLFSPTQLSDLYGEAYPRRIILFPLRHQHVCMMSARKTRILFKSDYNIYKQIQLVM